jgi:hypothetical protein
MIVGRKRKHPTKRGQPLHVALYQALKYPSWQAYTDATQRSGEPVRRERLQQLYAQLLIDGSVGRAIALHCRKGAYFQPELALRYLFELEDQLMLPANRILTIRLSFDNRYIWGKNQGIFMSLVDTETLHAPHRQFSLATVAGDENIDNLRAAFSEIGLDEFLQGLTNWRVEIDDFEYQLDFVIVADWMSFVAAFALDRPNARDADAVACWACGATKEDLDRKWLEEPFAQPNIELCESFFPLSALPSAPLYKYRYCWMHGVSNLLNNALLLLLDLAPVKGTFIAAVRVSAKQWDNKHALRPKDAKALIRSRAYLPIPAQFQAVRLPPLPWPDPPLELQLTTVQIVDTYFDAVRCFHDFAYTRKPSPAAFRSVKQAAVVYLAVFAATERALPPTSHFMCTHAIHFAELDGTAYHTLQEGTEHKNKLDIAAGKRTVGPNRVFQTGESGWQQLLNRHLVIDLLLQRYPELDEDNNAPPSRLAVHQLQDVQAVRNVPPLLV